MSIEARAKLNLGLVVGPRRADGFHELVTLFQSVSLADTLEIRPRARGFTLDVRFEDAALDRARSGGARRATAGGAAARDRAITAGRDRARGLLERPSTRSIPLGDDNLVLRAARGWCEALGVETGAAFRLIKRIPAGAGLGGGSADAAAVLIGLAALHRVRPSIATVRRLAEALGSDVPFMLRGGTALGRGRGERLDPVRLARPFRALIAVPSWRISTSRAFAEIDGRKNVLTLWSTKLRSANLLGRKRLSVDMWLRLGNTFENVLGDRQKAFISLRDRLFAAGATDVRMTGSGSAVFGILEPETSSRQMIERFDGTEALFLVRSHAAGLITKPLP